MLAQVGVRSYLSRPVLCHDDALMSVARALCLLNSKSEETQRSLFKRKTSSIRTGILSESGSEHALNTSVSHDKSHDKRIGARIEQSRSS